MSSIHSEKKYKRLNLVEFATFPHNFILTPHKVFKKEKSKEKVLKPPEQLSPVLPKKNIGTRWSFNNIPNLSGIRTARRLTSIRNILSREDTFDADFMMPTRVREVLESEGLEKNTINSTIGKSEAKHKATLKKMADQGIKGDNPLINQLPSVITTQKSPRHVDPGSSSAWLDLAKEETRDVVQPMWENPFTNQKERFGQLTWSISKATKGSVEAEQYEIDKRKWESSQHAEKLFVGSNFDPPRIVLVSSKIPKCHLLTKVYRENVIPIIYDFEAWALSDILETVTRKLETYRRRCKAKSIMVLCQGGPGYIYLLRNYVITPQKLHKPSYRRVLEFWKCLGEIVSKLNPQDAAIHIFGFKLQENDQGKKLIPMLQSLMYPNVVTLSNPYEDTEEGKEVMAKYFDVSRYKIWRINQNTSRNELDFTEDETDQHKQKEGRQTLSLKVSIT